MAYPMTFILMACLSVFPFASADTKSNTLLGTGTGGDPLGGRERANTFGGTGTNGGDPVGGRGRANTFSGPGTEPLGAEPGPPVTNGGADQKDIQLNNGGDPVGGRGRAGTFGGTGTEPLGVDRERANTAPLANGGTDQADAQLNNGGVDQPDNQLDNGGPQPGSRPRAETSPQAKTFDQPDARPRANTAPVGAAPAGQSGVRFGTLSALQGIIGDLRTHGDVLNQLTDDNKLGKDTEEWRKQSTKVWTETMGLHGQAQVLLSKMMAAHIVLSMQAKGMHVEHESIDSWQHSPTEKVKLLSTMYKIYPMHLRRLKDHYDHPAGKNETINTAAADIVANHGGWRGEEQHGNGPNGIQ